MIMQIFENDWRRIFLVFCITIFPQKAQNKNKVGIKTTFLLMMENTWSKKPDTKALFEQMSSRRNIKSDPIAAIHSMCHNTR